MNGSQLEGQDGPALPHRDTDAERHVAHLTGMTPEAARTFVAFHAGSVTHSLASTSAAARSPERTAPSM